jgi:hypothetical protein
MLADPAQLAACEAEHRGAGRTTQNRVLAARRWCWRRTRRRIAPTGPAHRAPDGLYCRGACRPSSCWVAPGVHAAMLGGLLCRQSTRRGERNERRCACLLVPVAIAPSGSRSTKRPGSHLSFSETAPSKIVDLERTIPYVGDIIERFERRIVGKRPSSGPRANFLIGSRQVDAHWGGVAPSHEVSLLRPLSQFRMESGIAGFR